MAKPIKKLVIQPKTLDEKIVKDGLEAVGLLNDKVPYYLVGGVAIQSYLPSSCRRPTSDIDFSVVKSLNYADFKELIKPVFEYLKDHKYEVGTEKRSRAYALDILNSEGEILTLEFVRRNEQSFLNNKKKLEREFENSKRKILEERDSTYNVACPEDICAPKLARSINSLVRNPDFLKYVPKDLEEFTLDKINGYLDRISFLRKEAMLNPADPYLAEKLRFSSDLYDIRILSELAGLNPKYWKEAEKDWMALSGNLEEKDILIRSVIPLIE
jgi:hypothetical protein